jgi:hypothetical protein
LESIEKAQLTSRETTASARSRWRRIGPIVTLLVLAPFVSEVLFGGTRVSVIFVFIPEIMTWGCGALLIRYWVRRWQKGWGSMLLLGLALAAAEELVIQQTSIAPLAGLAKNAYGREFGVNWVYLLWALGYESVWVVLVPVQFTELLFPGCREDVWLRTRGMVIASVVFTLGSFMAWYSWTQRARVQVFHMAPYSPPPMYLFVGAAVVAMLILAGYALPNRKSGVIVSRTAPSPWLVGMATCILGSPWAAFALFGFGTYPNIPYTLVLGGGLTWGAVTLFLLMRWTASPGWGDSQRYALVFGGVLACMIGGFAVFKVGGALRIDWIGKAVLNAATLVWLIVLGRRERSRRVN